MRIHTVAIAVALLAVPATAQTANDGGLRAQRQPYDIHSFGAFRMLILQGDFSPKVGLTEVTAKHPTVGVGAVADARGEITIHDGKLIISYGKDGPHPSADAERAALLSVGTVAAWQTVKVERDVAPEEIDVYLSRTAGAHGLNPDGPFPFQVSGTLASYVMHVNAAPTGGPYGMGQPIAITRESKGETIAGMVSGIYVSPDLVGIVSHGGTRSHSHFVAPDGQSTAHLDRWGLKAGSELMLPKP